MGNWKLFFARDAWLWSVLFYVGFVFTVGMAFITDPVSYGIGPITWKWLQLLAAVVTALAGKLGLSMLARKTDVEQDGRLL